MSAPRAAAWAAGAAAWALAAWLLLPTAVPDGLDLPAVAVDEVFGRETVAAAHEYRRVPLVLWPLSQAVLLGALWLYARRGARLARESAGGPVATGILLGMLGPLGLVMGAPVTLLLGSAPVTVGRAVTGLLRTRPVHVVSHPVTAAALPA